MIDTMGQTETTDNGVLDNTTTSLRAGKRGYVLLEDTIVRKKMLHFDRERAPERVVHALGHAAYGISPKKCANLATDSQQAPSPQPEIGVTSHLHAGYKETPPATSSLVSLSL
jgi:catalase